jgi:small subunit ribosomal protein S6
VSETLREYETVFILDPTLEENKVNEEVERASGVIRDQGGTVGEVERWGRRRLAYEIGKRRDGVYTLIRYHAEGPTVKELERRLRLNETVLRVLTVVVDPRYKELLAAMAQAAAAAPDGETNGHGRGMGDDDEAPRRRSRRDRDSDD